MNWSWKDGRLAAKPLFEALEALGLNPNEQTFCNLWTDDVVPKITRWRVSQIRKHSSDAGTVVVAMGKKVSAELARRAIPHTAIVHPAARGRIRKRHRYIKHVTSTLDALIPASLEHKRGE